MSYARDEANPLRPYYKPPSIGIYQDTPVTTNSGTHGLGPKNGSAASYASSARAARDMLADIDYSEYLSDSSPSAFDSVRKQVDDWFYRYMSVLLSQPFDVAKTVLQVKSHAVEDASRPTDEVRRQESHRSSKYTDVSKLLYTLDQMLIMAQYHSDDSDPDEPAYFTSTAPSSTSYSPPRPRRRRASSRELSPVPAKPTSSLHHQLILKNPDSILEVISQEWAKEAGWGVWKASNTTFIYGILLQTLEKWSRGLLSAMLNVPDPELTAGLAVASELVASPYPWASLGVAIAAAVAAGVILAPLDLIRTKYVVPLSMRLCSDFIVDSS
jgi:fusion and transport protein UGO1